MGFAWGFKKDFAKQGYRELQRTCGELSVTTLLVICLCFSSRKQDVFNSDDQVSVSKPEPSGLGLCGCLVCSELLCISVVMVKHWALASGQLPGRRAGTQMGVKQKPQRNRGKLFAPCLPRLAQLVLFTQPRSSCLRTVSLTLGWNVPHPSLIKSIELRQ